MSNIILIGMPGAGKSTLGVLLAKHLAKRFIDTDLLIQERAGTTLQAIVDEQGYLALRRLEEQVLCSLNVDNAVIATGGSAVYSAAAMTHLKRQGICVYLQLPLATVEHRVTNMQTRGLAAAAGQSLADIFIERQPLYEHYAEMTIDCEGKTVEEVVGDISGKLRTSSYKLQATSGKLKDTDE